MILSLIKSYCYTDVHTAHIGKKKTACVKLKLYSFLLFIWIYNPRCVFFFLFRNFSKHKNILSFSRKWFQWFVSFIDMFWYDFTVGQPVFFHLQLLIYCICKTCGFNELDLCVFRLNFTLTDAVTHVHFWDYSSVCHRGGVFLLYLIEWQLFNTCSINKMM